MQTLAIKELQEVSGGARSPERYLQQSSAWQFGNDEMAGITDLLIDILVKRTRLLG